MVDFCGIMFSGVKAALEYKPHPDFFVMKYVPYRYVVCSCVVV